ncbi:hypothetical protein BJ875DRAFT_481808 [Amylocarpus encephaloides]|uniref:BTB domain-containing protein n=1 Tax=Amylocarpus encephaloides TaxID=45428 RepID=A0A9P7YPP2_9HELO|nr:hypothetical protein BJ875DRAFT_481808 [Amylocarpus encephaloides]
MNISIIMCEIIEPKELDDKSVPEKQISLKRDRESESMTLPPAQQNIPTDSASTTSPKAVSSAKRPKLMVPVNLKDLPVMGEYASGPQVVVIVEGEEHQVSKAFLCERSDFFVQSFKDEGKGGQEQKVTLPGTKQAFKHFLEWEYRGALDLTPESITDNFRHVVSFFRLVMKLSLSSNFAPVIQKVRRVITANPKILQSDHVREGMKLPRSRPLRKLMITACAEEYLGSLGKNWSLFKFKAEWDINPYFVRDLVDVLRPAFRALWRDTESRDILNLWKSHLQDK